MITLLKILDFVKSIDKKTLAFIGGAILMLFMLKQCNTISNLKSDLKIQEELTEINFNNYLASHDSVKYFENEIGDKVAQISSFQFEVSQLERTNIEIENKYIKALNLNKDLAGVNSLLSADIRIKDSLLAMSTLTEIDSVSSMVNFNKEDDFGSGNTRIVNGNLIIRYDSSGSFTTSPVNLSIAQTLSLSAAVEELEGRETLKITSSYPGLTITGIENISLINQRLNDKNKINNKAGFSIGMGIGYGINYNTSNSSITLGPSINVGLYWSPKWLRF